MTAWRYRSKKFELINKTKKILGYTCRKAKTIINSNTIEVWYTNELNLKGAPEGTGFSAWNVSGCLIGN